jgi:hypothetical protein
VRQTLSALIKLGVFLFCLTLLFNSAQADIPKRINFQGVLKDSLGNPVSNGVYTIRFRIYDDSTAGSALWEETVPVLTSAGLFTVRLGDATPLPNNVFSTGVNRFVGIRVNLDPEITPRTRLASVEFAFHALRSDTAGVALNVLGDSFLPLAGGTLTGPLKIDFASGTGNEVEFTPSSTGAYLDLKDNGSYKATLFSEGDASALVLQDNGNDITVSLGSGTNTGGSLILNQEDGTPGTLLRGGSTSDGASLGLRNAAGTNVINLDADAAASYINTGGNLGIGTTTPAYNLHIFENVNADVGLRIENPNAGGAAQERIDFGDGLAHITLFGPTDEMSFANNRTGGTMTFDVGGSQRLFISNGGNVGIGTTSPSATLHIFKSAFPSLALDDAGATVWSFTHDGSNLNLNVGGGTSTRFTAGGNAHFGITGGNVGIGTENPQTRLHVFNFGDVATFDRGGSDGIIVRLAQDGITEGNISVSGTTVSYNAFTGSHYGWTDERLEEGELVSLTGINRNSHDDPKSEVIYGIKRSTAPNDPACLGSYLGLQSPGQPYSSDNPHLVTAVGNGEMWVVNEGKNIQPGDYLISSSISGHARKDDEEKYPIGHIVARAAESVDWSTVSESVSGRKHKRISVLFGNFVHSNTTILNQTIEAQQRQIENLEKRMLKLESGSLRSQTE